VQLNALRNRTAGLILQTLSDKHRPTPTNGHRTLPLPSVPRSSNQLLQALPSAEFEELRPHLQPVDLVREAVLTEAGAPLTHVYLPQSGVISMRIGLSEGQTVEVAMVGRDSVLGATAGFASGVSLTDAVVLLPGTASILDVAHFRAAADRSVAFRTLLARHEQALFAQVQQSAACNASHSVEARLSRWLLHTRDRTGSESLPLTQEILAQMIGVQRNAVSIVAHALQEAGILRYSRGHLEITSAEGLRETSCECYQAVKAQHDRLLRLPD
jgi:CRP-like cAMP-binding protein